MSIRPVTENMIEAIMFDEWPRSAAICDFGLVDQEHYEALYYPIRAKEISAEELDAALGNGEALTELVSRCKTNPHKYIVFITPYDLMGDDDEG